MTKEYTKEELDNASGMNKPNIVTWPSIKFASTNRGMGELGGFTLLSNDEDGKLVPKDLGKELKAIIINRGKLRLKSSEHISNEVSSAKELTLIFTKEKFRLYDKGEYYQMKEKYKLSTHQIPYLYLEDGTIAKLGVSPSSLSGFWEYLKSFSGEDRIYQFWTTMKASEKEYKKMGGTYHILDFIQGEKLEDDIQNKVSEAIMDTNEKIKANNEARRQTDTTNTDSDTYPDTYPEEEVQRDDIPVIDVESDEANKEAQEAGKSGESIEQEY